MGKHFDFVSVLYPKKGEIDKALPALAAYNVGTSLLVEETFPHECSQDELVGFSDQSAARADGWISFYWGTTAAELRANGWPEAMSRTADHRQVT